MLGEFTQMFSSYRLNAARAYRMAKIFAVVYSALCLFTSYYLAKAGMFTLHLTYALASVYVLLVIYSYYRKQLELKKLDLPGTAFAKLIDDSEKSIDAGQLYCVDDVVGFIETSCEASEQLQQQKSLWSPIKVGLRKMAFLVRLWVFVIAINYVSFISVIVAIATLMAP